MSLPKSRMTWLRLPSRLALLLGLGAVAAVGARAEAARSADHVGGALSDLRIQVRGGQVYVSERGGEYRALRLGQSPEARALARLLANSNRPAIDAASRAIILAGGGGPGFHWAPADKTGNAGHQPSNTSSPARKTAAPTAPHPKPHRTLRSNNPLGGSGQKG